MALARANAKTPALNIYSPASVPTRIVKANGVSATKGRKTRLLIGGAIGLLLGLVLAFVLERIDNSVRGAAAAENASGLPVIADIPYMRIKNRCRFEILSLTMPQSLYAEAYRGL